MKTKRFLITEAHGRVFKQVDAYTRVLVALPGDEISYELAEECGLIAPAPAPDLVHPEPLGEIVDLEEVEPVEVPPYKQYPRRVQRGR